MSLSYDIEKYISTYHGSKYDEFKRLKHGLKHINIVNPLRRRESEDVQLVRMLLDPNYCYFTCKYILGINLMPYQTFFLRQVYNHARPLVLASRGYSKSFSLGVYAMYKAFIKQGSKIVIVGSGFRQSKMVFEVCERVWAQADVLRDILGSKGARNKYNGPHYSPDQLSMTIGKSEIIAIPIGIQGQKIRGFRSNVIIADEFDSHDLDIFERVIKGFGAVSEDPAEKVRLHQAIEAAAKLGITQSELGIDVKESFNQEIIAGTVSYKEGNLGNYYDKYKAIIEAGGDLNALKQSRPNDYEKLIGINHRHYCIFRVPYTLLPSGYLSKIDIDSAKATSSSDIFNSEYGCVFLDDSAGFFRKTLIDGCTASFMPSMRGIDDKQARYVIGVDPASEHDNTSIVVLEVYNNQKRIVYCYTTNRKKFAKDQESSKTSEKKFYSYAAKKIYDIAVSFGLNEGRVVRIDMDSEGGGREIRDELLVTERPIYELVVLGEPKMTDHKEGPHIINLVKFQDYNWVSAANHGLKRDMEQKNILFPKYDPYLLLASEMTEGKGGFEHYKNVKLLDKETVDDTIESVYDEIEFMKKELTSIIVRIAPGTGRESWTLPGKRSELIQMSHERKKDRYSALIIANSAANEITRGGVDPIPESSYVGILADKIQKKKKTVSEQMFYGNVPHLSLINAMPVGLVRKRR